MFVEYKTGKINMYLPFCLCTLSKIRGAEVFGCPEIIALIKLCTVVVRRTFAVVRR